MSKTFTGSITVDFKLVMSDEAIVDVDAVLMQTANASERVCFASYAAQLPTVDARTMATIKRGLRNYVKSSLQEVRDDTAPTARITFSPVTVTVKGKE
ncbi:hypothetical protein PP16_gp31 [Pectobacterium phage PP16]|uniref:Uncharacterized protein n=1 Tax=Pectobacterium phage PP16 TaxID=1873958 RepID=A0A1B1PEC8_9CAUD|nr:Gp5.5-like host HNS inhibition [Pectobacterium phage PP16]ANT45331.2 hypothetical protein PP16_gp31 [Pectobacterium phage PP16]